MAMATLLSKCRQHSAVLQLSKTSVAVYSFISSSAQVLSSSSPIIGIDIWDSFVLTWSETKAELFNIQESGRHLETSFSSSANDHFALHRNFIFRAQGMTIQVLDLQGSLNHKLELNEPQGNVVGLDVSEDFLVVATENGYLQMWRFVDGFWKTFLPDMGRKVALVTKGPCNICSLKCNYNGTKVSFVVGRKTGELLASTLCIYDSGLDKFYHHDFSSKGKMLVTHCWDSEEFQQFACQVKPVDGRKYGLDAQSGILTFFVDNMKGIIKLDKKDIEDDKVSLLGKHEPYLYIFEKLSYDENHLPKAPLIKKIPVGIVASMENVDRKTRQDLLNFTTAIFTGRMMEAYRFIESMNDILTLKKMAYYCMEHELLDAAMSCFAQMGRAYAVSAIDSMNYGDPNLHENETKAAMVAIHLGCIEDAEKLYIKCKRYDLLAELYQTCGNWDKAIETSSKYDSLNLKNLHHTYAKYLEAIGDIQKAVHHYELSNTHRYEVPHMLYSIGRVDDLKKYIDEKKDLSLHKWWANYCEAQNLLQDAIEQYKLAGDVSSAVRLYVFLGDMGTAESLVAETSDPAATFQLGQQHEKLGNIQRAMKLFAKAGKSDSAAHLAMKHGIDKELLSLALQGTKKTMLTSAKYFEDKELFEGAVLLYQKGGDLEKAIDICVHCKLFDALRTIADNLNEETDPSLLARCADCLLLHKQFEKAILLLIAAGQHRRAFDLCISESVRITDKMMELFSRQISEENLEDSKHLLTALAEFCEAQGSFHLACKTYTQAGDKVKAMQVLMKSGDTDKILTYANVSRQKQLYVLAANYLQTLNWHSDANIMKKIVQMYTKAAEMELLASFYEACAQIEIDGFRDYEKALAAMKEARKFLSKVQSPQRDAKMHSLKKRIEEVERFVQARRMVQTDPNGMISACTQLLSDLSSKRKDYQEAALRIGDLYALLIEYYYKEGNFELAYQTIQQMDTSKLPTSDYIDPNIITAIYKANGIPV